MRVGVDTAFVVARGPGRTLWLHNGGWEETMLGARGFSHPESADLAALRVVESLPKGYRPRVLFPSGEEQSPTQILRGRPYG